MVASKTPPYFFRRFKHKLPLASGETINIKAGKSCYFWPDELFFVFFPPELRPSKLAHQLACWLLHLTAAQTSSVPCVSSSSRLTGNQG